MITYIQVRMSANRRGRSNVNETMGEQRATSVISVTIGTFRVHSHLASSDRSMLRCWERYVIVGGVISQQEWSVLRRRARVLSSCGSHEIYRDRRATKMARLPPARLKACTLGGTVWVRLPACKCPLLSLPAHFISKLRDRYIAPGW